jgi:Ca2+-binding RTX toxin-like protein
MVRWEAMEAFVVHPTDSDGLVTLVGGPGSERFTVFGWLTTVTADLGAGDDSLLIDKLPEEGSRLDGGAGHDGLTTGHDGELSWDLTESAIKVGADRALPATGFEDAQLTAPLVELRGTAGPNHLAFVASHAVLRGRGGDDTLELGTNNPDFGEFYWGFKPLTTDLAGGAGDDRLATRRKSDDRLSGGAGADVLSSSGGDDRLLGGPGRDRATGGGGDDVVVGGPGKDSVDGGPGRDRCVAERERRCE